MLAEFMAGKQRVIVAISALGMGVDILDIRCIIYMDWLWSILDYAQESGRAGRDGLQSEAIIIGQEGNQWTSDDKIEAEKQLVRLYIEGDSRVIRCRRRVLDEYLDGRESREGCEEGEERCDVCRGLDEEIEEDDSEEHSEAHSEDNQEEEEIGNVDTDREEVRRAFQQQE